jgi:hypothetical protein
MTPPTRAARRLYEHEPPVVYPGEQATAMIATYDHGTCVEVSLWLVEPMPGWRGWWRRTRYRWWGQWVHRGPRRLEVTDGPYARRVRGVG